MALTAAGRTIAGGPADRRTAPTTSRRGMLSAPVLAAPFGRPLLIAIGVGLGVAAVVALVRAFGPKAAPSACASRR